LKISNGWQQVGRPAPEKGWKTCARKVIHYGGTLAPEGIFATPSTEAKFIIKSSLFILLPGFVRRLELKPISNKKLRIYSSPHHISKPPAALSLDA